MPACLAVLRLSESFVDLWPRIAASAEAAIRSACSIAELGRLGDCCGVVVAAGGEERAALDVLDQLRSMQAPPVAVVGAETEYRLALALVRGGADSYFALPDDLGVMRSWIFDRVDRAHAVERTRRMAAEQRERYDFSRMIGRSPSLLLALERASRVIPSGAATVLVTGETGTGKELLARAIHYNGPRATRPFVEINCTALPENLLEAELFGYEAGAFTDARIAKPGLLEAADGGTLFLDEIGDLSLSLQGKLLRVLEDKRVRRLGSLRDQEIDLRIIAATNVDLQAAIEERRFREDLYYRLTVVPIELPPLRERGDDVTLLARHFLERFTAEYQLPRLEPSREFQRALLAHPWPGNVRELRNAIERAVLLGEGALSAEDLFVDSRPSPAGRSSAIPFPASMHEIQEAAARAMTELCGGNKSEAAKALGISRKHLYGLLNGRKEG